MNHFEQQVEDLLRDTSFISYCHKKDDREIAVWETRLLTQPELLPVVEEAKRRVRSMARGVITAEMETGLARLRDAVAGLKAEGTDALVAVHRPGYGRIRWLAAAALLAIASLCWLLYRDGRKQEKAAGELASNTRLIRVPAGQRKTMRLPDGSLVILNGGSNLEWNEHFNDTGREVSLTGEAYFDVTQDKRRPFIIHTRAMNIRVLGTAFNVRSYPDEPADATSLIRGKVEVTLLDAQHKQTGSYILRPMQKLVVERSARQGGTPSVTIRGGAGQTIHLDSLVRNPLVNGFTETAWTQHNLVFDDETLQQAALKMEKWFGVTVVFENDSLRNLRYTGTFENEDLKKALAIMQLSMPVLRYKLEKNKVILY